MRTRTTSGRSFRTVLPSLLVKKPLNDSDFWKYIYRLKSTSKNDNVLDIVIRLTAGLTGRESTIRKLLEFPADGIIARYLITRRTNKNLDAVVVSFNPDIYVVFCTLLPVCDKDHSDVVRNSV